MKGERLREKFKACLLHTWLHTTGQSPCKVGMFVGFGTGKLLLWLLVIHFKIGHTRERNDFSRGLRIIKLIDALFDRMIKVYLVISAHGDDVANSLDKADLWQTLPRWILECKFVQIIFKDAHETRRQPQQTLDICLICLISYWHF